MLLLPTAVFSKRKSLRCLDLTATDQYALEKLLVDQTVTSWNHFLGFDKQLIHHSDFLKLQIHFVYLLKRLNWLKDYSLSKSCNEHMGIFSLCFVLFSHDFPKWA
jgi:hypothetical protein